MRYWKRGVFILAAFSLTMALTACGSSEKIEADGKMKYTTPDHIYEEVREDILIDADVVRPEEGIVPKVYQIERSVITKESMEDFLEFCGDGIQSMESEIVDDNGYYYNLNTNKGMNLILNVLEDVNIGGCGFSYVGLNKDYHWYKTLVQYSRDRQGIPGDGDNTYNYEQPQEFAFATAAEAEENVRECLENLGIRNAVREEIFYLDHSTLQRVMEEDEESLRWESEEMRGEPYIPKEWSEEDDCYMFSFCCAVDGITSVQSVRETAVAYVDSCRIEALYNTNGVVFLMAHNLWSTTEVVEKPKTIISEMDAMLKAREKLVGVFSKRQRVVQEVALRYCPVQDKNGWLLYPVWEILVCEQDVSQEWSGAITDEYSYILIDALTGEEL